MPRSKSEIWNHFIEGGKQNGSHYEAYCRWCIAKRASAQLGEDGTLQFRKTDPWVITVMAHMHRENDEMKKKGEKNDSMKGVVTGKRESMVPHILNCPNASAAAKELARKLKEGAKGNGNTKKRMREEDTEDDEVKNPTKKRVPHTNLVPTKISFLRELDTPFTDVQVEGIRAQLEKTTVSANLPDGWFENLEVIKLFKMIYETARGVMPSRQQVGGGELLHEVDGEDEEMDDEDEEMDDGDEEMNDEAKDRAEHFASWYCKKSGIFQQALMHAMDIMHHPERINQTFFYIECELHPDHENRASEDKYRLRETFMAPLDGTLVYEGYQYMKALDKQAKSRGHIGAIFVEMVDATDVHHPAVHRWLLAIPYSTKDAQKILEDTKWGNVWWASRLRDILEVPESSYEFVYDELAKLPDHLLCDTPMTDYRSVNRERFQNDPNCEYFDGDPQCDYTGRHIALEEGDYTYELNEMLTYDRLAKRWLEHNQSAGRLLFLNGFLYKVPGPEAGNGVVSNRYNRVGSFQSP
ncbi:hypothetical protein Moror_13504 [Moniliophthora roreri MCA 2997]|uniref:Uncharacterized protein n=2 Tax=Moniliophthora roreri TaxID=221103 RepID=V2WQI3_MONRO|nr:hypothetical protein Moror_13504 [Moniliophthora roreri MCA 2997]KAI3607565.1 hypothetical protein WG66_004642 [Moniliophthora roreri]